MNIESLGRLLILGGLGLVVIGGLFLLFGRLGLPLGRLPGDFRFQIGQGTCLIPLASSIILSLVLTLLLNILIRFFNR
jgi:hypothetical protein